jgi:hypothetical protein
MVLIQTNAVPIWRDPGFIVAATTLLTVLAKWLTDLRTNKKHDQKLDTVVTQTNGINTRLSNQNATLTETVKEQAKTIAAVAPPPCPPQ